MKVRLSSDKSEEESKPKAAFLRRGTFLFALAVLAFTYALLKSIYRHPNDLRIPPVLVLDFLLATGVALGYAIYNEVSLNLRSVSRCFAFGLWSAAIFRLAPIIGNERVLFDAQSISFDVPYILLFAAVRGLIVVLFVWPFARRVLCRDRSIDTSIDDQTSEIGIAAVAVFYVVASVVLFATTDFS